MPVLIDGYNLLYVVGIARPKAGVGALERSRLALLNFLAASLDPRELPLTTVVFDAREAPPGARATMEHHGLKVRFASRYPDADSLIEELILADSAPRRLTVVSSDHRLQKAARRRRARAVDSDVWYAEVVRARRERRKRAAPGPERPAVPLLEEDVNYWVREFGGEAALEQWTAEQGESRPGAKNTGEASATQPPSASEPLKEIPADVDNPFPPGYGEDLLREEDDPL